MIRGAHSGSHLELSVRGDHIVVKGSMAGTRPAAALHPRPQGRGLPDRERVLDRSVDGPVRRQGARPGAPASAADDPLGGGSDKLIGNAERDTCYPGGARRNRCIGGGGNDVCITGDRNSDCVGGRGNDYCKHGTGSDGCWGGPGATSASWAPDKTAATATAATTASTAAPTPTSSTAAPAATTATAAPAGAIPTPASAALGANGVGFPLSQGRRAGRSGQSFVGEEGRLWITLCVEQTPTRAAVDYRLVEQGEPAEPGDIAGCGGRSCKPHRGAPPELYGRRRSC